MGKAIGGRDVVGRVQFWLNLRCLLDIQVVLCESMLYIVVWIEE